MSIYQTAKYAVSDATCAVLSPVSPESFGQYCPRFIDGFFVTVELLVLSCSLGLVIAIGVAFARLSSNPFLNGAAFAYSYILRGTPLLVQLWIVYFGFGSLGAENLGFLWPLFKDGWTIGLIVLTLNTSSYVSEILRGGLVNIPKGQMEAAVATGMSWFQSMFHIMLPQAFKIAWPAYGNEVVLLMKGSALVSTITVLDLMGQTRTVFSRSYNLEVYAYSAILYLLLAGTITLLFKFGENRMKTG
jgi:His/Glu/Gln/Arg/opine family amino acid ABC transporter permease subunit